MAYKATIINIKINEIKYFAICEIRISLFRGAQPE